MARGCLPGTGRIGSVEPMSSLTRAGKVFAVLAFIASLGAGGYLAAAESWGLSSGASVTHRRDRQHRGQRVDRPTRAQPRQRASHEDLGGCSRRCVAPRGRRGLNRAHAFGVGRCRPPWDSRLPRNVVDRLLVRPARLALLPCRPLPHPGESMTVDRPSCSLSGTSRPAR